MFLKLNFPTAMKSYAKIWIGYSQSVLFLLTFLQIFLIGILDYLTRSEMSFSIFYLIPIALIAWYDRFKIAAFFAVLGSVVWITTDFLSNHNYTLNFILFWNMGVRLTFFMIISITLSKFKIVMNYEFDLAAQIQKGFLPKSFPEIPGFEIIAKMVPARNVCGDYYDILPIDYKRLVLCVADAMGHGIAASMLISDVATTLKLYSNLQAVPAQLCEKLNRIIFNNTAPEKFVTLFYGLLDTRERKLLYTNAGHNAPILVRNDGSVQLLEQTGTVIGFMEDVEYRMGVTDLLPGDLLVLYTDGAIELKNSNDEEYGINRFVKFLIENINQKPALLLDNLLMDLESFGRNNHSDDITVLLVKVT